MKITATLIKRNVKLFFKDKGMFFTSLITPVILLVLYTTFLKNVYRDSFIAGLPMGVSIDGELVDALVRGQLTSSILAVSCVTVAFGSNFLMVQDRATGVARDLLISPVNQGTLSLCYYISSLASTAIIAFSAAGLCLVYQAIAGWYFSVVDVLLILFDVLLLILFGTAVSSVINRFLSTQGQIAAVGTIVSSGYGFISGAYMPISSFGKGIQGAVKLLPGTYGTSLLRKHSTSAVFEKMNASGIDSDVTKSMADAIDANLYLGDYAFTEPIMYLILGGATLIFIGAYVFISYARRNKTKKD